MVSYRYVCVQLKSYTSRRLRVSALLIQTSLLFNGVHVENGVNDGSLIRGLGNAEIFVLNLSVQLPRRFVESCKGAGGLESTITIESLPSMMARISVSPLLPPRGHKTIAITPVTGRKGLTFQVWVVTLLRLVGGMAREAADEEKAHSTYTLT